MTTCPHCGRTISTEPSFVGWVAYCDNCTDGAEDVPQEIAWGSTKQEALDAFVEKFMSEEDRTHCHVCDGSGQGRRGGTCPECRGWGFLPTEAELEEAVEREIDEWV